MRFKIDWAIAFQLEGNLPFLLCFTLYLRAISKYKLPRGGGGYLIHGGAFFRDFSVRPEMYAMAMMASGKKIARGLVKIYKRLQEVLPLSGEIDKNGESDEKGESGENYSHGFGFGQYSN